MPHTQCPECKSVENTVKDSRPLGSTCGGNLADLVSIPNLFYKRGGTRRRVQCLNCGHRYGTIEVCNITIAEYRAKMEQERDEGLERMLLRTLGKEGLQQMLARILSRPTD